MISDRHHIKEACGYFFLKDYGHTARNYNSRRLLKARQRKPLKKLSRQNGAFFVFAG